MIRRAGWKFSFDPEACQKCKGNCCIGESGYIWVNKKKILEISAHLMMEPADFFTKYIEKFGNKYSLKEEKIGENNYRCIFFDMNKRQCSIYTVRPKQCSTFPFWKHFKRYPEEARDECPGIYLDKE